MNLTTKAWCHLCEKEVEIAAEWEPFACPECGLEGVWDEQCTEDYSDCWVVHEWDWDDPRLKDK
jgi:predicted RNA-binding Zn-ribbon protein involved in translation (DUF1610 family)